MEIDKISSNLNQGLEIKNHKSVSPFKKVLDKAIETVNKYQNDYSALIQKQMQGDEINLHDLVIAGEKAQLTLELTLQVRNKALEAYQEIMRMQV